MQMLRDGECVLRIKQPTHVDVGRYSCCATNIIGRDSCSADVYVEGAELIDSTSYISKEAMDKINLATRLTLHSVIYAANVCVFCVHQTLG